MKYLAFFGVCLVSGICVVGDLTEHQSAALTAVEQGDLTKLVTLEHDHLKGDFSFQDDVGMTPMHLAAMYSHHSIVDWLGGHGADANAVDVKGWTPLMLAADNGASFVCELLLKKYGADVSRQNAEGNSALHLAALIGNPDVIEILLENGAPHNQQDKNGKSALDLARASAHPEAGEVLQQHSDKAR